MDIANKVNLTYPDTAEYAERRATLTAQLEAREGGDPVSVEKTPEEIVNGIWNTADPEGGDPVFNVDNLLTEGGDEDEHDPDTA